MTQNPHRGASQVTRLLWYLDEPSGTYGLPPDRSAALVSAMSNAALNTHQKAFQVNMDAGKYGTFAEIGAGQEVARWFFRVGGAAGTVAKTISAYDMTVSDAIYGSSERYVSRDRLLTMLDYEYSLLQERLAADRGATTEFFVFADTVKARSYLQQDESHGWMGVRFQHQPLAAASQIIIHVRMLDRENLQQQEALGILGVNLVHGAMHLNQHPEDLISSLVDNLTTGRVEIDLIKFSGAAFEDVDNRLMCLQLVTRGLTQAAMFKADGEVIQPAELLYNKPILVERGSFRPVTKATWDMLKCAQATFVQEPQVQDGEVVVLMEMTLKSLREGAEISHRDFLDRVDILGALGRTVLISNHFQYFRLATYLFRYTKKMIGVVLGVPSLKEVFQEAFYDDLEGGILESFGRLFKNDLKLYVYPLKESQTGALITAGNLRVAPNLRHLYAYLVENRFIEGIRDFDEESLVIFPAQVLAKIQSGDPSWEQMVPPQVAQMIKERRLFSYRDHVDQVAGPKP